MHSTPTRASRSMDDANLAGYLARRRTKEGTRGRIRFARKESARPHE